jgi:hypothetical protein
MSKPITHTKIQGDGLRYKAKVSGSPFGGSTNHGSATMSCFLCGKHRLRVELKTRNLMGKSHAVCSPKCGA